MSEASLPSGEQWTINRGPHRAVAVEVGGGLREYSVGGRPVLDGYAATAMCDGARCQTLVPWPNRVRDGQWSWQGEDQQLAITEPEQHNAIHGLVRWAAWSATARTDDSVTLSCTSHPQPGYPWTITVTNQWSLADDGLTAVTTITNRGDAAAPVGAGFHPYVTVGTPTIDAAWLTIRAATWLPTGDQQIPTGREPVTGSPLDFRERRQIGDVRIDHTFTDLERDADGRFTLRLQADDGAEVAVWTDRAYPYLEIFTGDALPDAGRRRQGLGVEPMSMPPNGMATGEGVTVLQPGESWVGSWGIVTKPV